MEVKRKPIRSFKDLEVYQRSYQASILVCKEIVPRLPKEERYDLSDQLRRSSKAVPRLIAEGYGKKHQVKGFQKYIDDSISEANETQVGLSHARDLYGRQLNINLCEKLIKEYDIIARQLYRLRQSWQNFKSISKPNSISKQASKPKPKPNSQKGLSLIELLLVIGILAIIGASVTPFLSSFILRNNLETTTDKVISIIRKAQNYALDGKNNAAWGVCLTGSNLRLFSLSCASPDFSEDFTVPASVTVTGLTETTFSHLRGEPSSALNITISTNIDSVTVQVNEGGGMDVN